MALFDDADQQAIEQTEQAQVNETSSAPVEQTREQVYQEAEDNARATERARDASGRFVKSGGTATDATATGAGATNGATQAQATGQTQTAQDATRAAAAAKRAWKVYAESGEEVTDPQVLAAIDALAKYKFGYSAMGKEQRKAIDEVFRNASLGHFNEHMLNTTRQERDQAMQRAIAAEERANEHARDRKLWDYSLQQLAMGNQEPILRMLEQYQQTMQEQVFGDEQDEDTTQVDESRGQQMWFTQIVPRAAQIAASYGVAQKSVEDAITFYITREGTFLTPEKLEQILAYQIPAWLEGHGRSAGGVQQQQQAQPGSTLEKRLAELERRNQELTAKLENQNLAAVKSRGAAAPPAGSGAASGGATVPKLTSKEDMKRYLRGEMDD